MKIRLTRLTFAAVVAVVALSSISFAGDKFVYPEAPVKPVVDDYFGVKITDPYRWLEDANSPETQAWVDAENKLTHDFVNTPEREKFREEYAKMYDYTKYSTPRQKDGRLFYNKNEGLQNQSILYMQKDSQPNPVVVFDPNKFAPDGSVGLGTYSVSPDGRYIACGLSYSGHDEQLILIKDIDTDKFLADTIRYTRLDAPAWLPNDSGFFYSRFPRPDEVDNEEDMTYYQKVCWHTLGTPQSEDVIIYEDPVNKRYGFEPQVTDDGRFLVIHVWRGTDRENLVYYKELMDNGPVVKLLNDWDAEYRFLGNYDYTFYFQTDLGAPLGRVISINVRKSERSAWNEVVSERDDVLEGIKLVNMKFVGRYLHDAYSKLYIYFLDGSFEKEIPLPTMGTVNAISCRQRDRHVFINFGSFLYPNTIFKYDFDKDNLTTFFKSNVDFNPDLFVTKQEFCQSKDGTRIPIFITHLKTLKQDGSNPTLLYGYGGFQVNETPFFSVSRSLWMKQGGILAVAVTRGGNEYGEAWHRAGMLENKQNVFDDFIAAAEYLIKARYTNTSRLAIEGGSNGGLLVAACMVQRPDLFGAVICEVPLTDMLRYQNMGVGHWWQGEYGNADLDSEQFKYLRAYSPYHNIKKGTTYPPALITTADGDDRVSPGHAKKFAAALQAADSGQNPILLRVEGMGGHGHTLATDVIINEVADTYGFLFKVFDMKVKDFNP